MIPDNKEQGILSDKELQFIAEIDARFPDKRIADNFEKFLAKPAEERPALARKILEKTPRTGYVLRGISEEEAETVAEHVDNMKEMAEEQPPAGLSLRIILAIIDAHDLGEAITSDFTPHDRDLISDKEKKQLEYLAIKVISQNCPSILNAWQMYAEGDGLEALYVKDLDKAQMYKKSIGYGITHPDIDLTDILENVESRKWATSAGETLFAQLHSQRYHKSSPGMPGPALS